jgi:short-subunit dehydrogenase
MKTFLSIGAGPGMGAATAERFAREGFHVVLSARNAAQTQMLADQLKGQGYEAEARTVDASDPSSVANLVASVEREVGAIDVLHYNAASMRRQTLADQPADSFNSDLAVNIGGALAAAQAVTSKMTERGAGTILLTGGGLALYPQPDYLSLGIGKAGIRSMALGLFESLQAKGIHVATVTVGAAVHPGSEEAKAVAELFWTFHSQPAGAWTVEVAYPPVA